MPEVEVATIFFDGIGLRMQCLMTDKTVWLCKPDGTEWVQLSGRAWLTKMFNDKKNHWHPK